MSEYDVSYITCGTCRYKVKPRLVHTEGGDYFCLKCNGGVNISHFCLHCRIENLY